MWRDWFPFNALWWLLSHAVTLVWSAGVAGKLLVLAAAILFVVLPALSIGKTAKFHLVRSGHWVPRRHRRPMPIAGTPHLRVVKDEDPGVAA